MREVVKQSQSELEQTEVTAIATMDNAAPAVLRHSAPRDTIQMEAQRP